MYGLKFTSTLLVWLSIRALLADHWKSATVSSLDPCVMCFRPNLSELSAAVETLQPQRPAGGCQVPVEVQGLETMRRLRRLKRLRGRGQLHVDVCPRSDIIFVMDSGIDIGIFVHTTHAPFVL